MPTTNPVSYTHLDVYKRQIKGYLDEAGKAQNQVSELKREVFRLQQKLEHLQKNEKQG